MFQGSIVALVTPMHDNGLVDENGLAELIEFHIESGTDGIVAVGTTGESATLTVQEHMEVVKQIIKYVNKRVPVIAGTGANSTAEAIELTSKAKQLGADACLLVTPYYNKPTQEGLFQHFKTIAQSVDIPQILYNVPGRTAVDMLPQTTQRLSRISNIVAIKEALGKVERIKQLLGLCAQDFAVLTGDDASAMESILAGASGDISVTANVVPKQMHLMCAAALQGDQENAQAIEKKIGCLHTELFLESNPIPVKWALAQMGKIGEGIRLPMTVLSSQFHKQVREALKTAGAM